MSQKPGKDRNEDRNEDGYVVVMVAMLLVVFLAFVALAVDSGILVDSRTKGQSVADAAALAGAFTFVADPAAAQPAMAIAHATALATDQDVLGDSVDVTDVAVTVDVANQRVTVDLTYAEETFFARVLGINTADIGVQGIAEAGLNAIGSSCVKPWFIPSTILSDKPPCLACNDPDAPTIRETIIDGNWASGSVPFGLAHSPAKRIKPGNPQQAIAPGVFAAVRFPESQGGNDYRNAIGGCRDQPVRCAETYQIEPGNMIGPTKQGVLELIGDAPDTFVDIGVYRDSLGFDHQTSFSLVIAPIWDTCSMAGFCPDGDFPQGANTFVRVIGFAQIFVVGVQGNDVLAWIVDATSCADVGDGDGGEVSDEAAPLAIPVRLIRTGGA